MKLKYDAFKKSEVVIEIQARRKGKLLRTDNITAFCSSVFNNSCSNDDTLRHHSSTKWCLF
jgi:hypothetical protein